MKYFISKMEFGLITLTLIFLQFGCLHGQEESVFGSAMGPPTTWCYQDSKCGETTWSRLCLTGKAQSPIDLPEIEKSSCQIKNFPRPSYESSLFSLETNGRTVGIKLLDYEPIFQWKEQKASYGLHSIHLHWGANDSVGSEHTIHSKHFAFEMHLIHYRNDFNSIGEALSSGEKNALAIIALLFEVDPALEKNKDLEPLIRYLPGAYYPTSVVTVHVKFDIGKFMNGNEVYTYHGSLTSPSCDEQVMYMVWKQPSKISSSDLKVFRKVTNFFGKPLVNNYRSIQKLNDRKVELCEIKYNKQAT
ncbi:putative carbonic anhydrase 5 [Orchesella cincta]|uniref:Carbonic anhydrase n=1 Tax=Orchesella cincta TaxID=48709 RepID=A0A1D2MPQ2_ORCCI|nr:putative carbonic anhydrase 5 [Orchesella cincta]